MQTLYKKQKTSSVACSKSDSEELSAQAPLIPAPPVNSLYCRGDTSDHLGGFGVENVPQVYKSYLPPTPKNASGVTIILFVGLLYKNSTRDGKTVAPLNVVHDMGRVLHDFIGKPNKRVFILCDFVGEAMHYVAQMKEQDQASFFGFHYGKKENNSIYSVELFSMARMKSLLDSFACVGHVTHTIIHLSCHGTKSGFVFPVDGKSPECMLMSSAEFTQCITNYGCRRKTFWKAFSENSECHPLDLTLYLDVCHSGHLVALKWVFSITPKCVKRITVEPPEEGGVSKVDPTDPEKCHMHIVCLSACGPEHRTPDRLLGGVFSQFVDKSLLMNSAQTTIKKIVKDHIAYNACAFGMVMPIWFHMNKKIMTLMEDGFYWSTNMKCPGTEDLIISVPENHQDGPCRIAKRPWGA
jgi:hypothetical protein